MMAVFCQSGELLTRSMSSTAVLLFDKFDGVLLARQHRRVPGMLVVLANWLDKRDRGQAPIVNAGEKSLLVLEVFRLRKGAVGVLLEVDKGLVMKHEGRGRVAGQRIVPAAGVPGPGYLSIAQPLTDSRE
jgi:hypothetical protein